MRRVSHPADLHGIGFGLHASLLSPEGARGGCSAEQGFPLDGVDAVGAGGDDGNRQAKRVFEVGDVGARFFRQGAVGGDADGVALPAGQGFLYRLAARQFVRADRGDVEAFAVHVVGGADLDFRQGVKDVQFGQAQAADAGVVDGAAQRG